MPGLAPDLSGRILPLPGLADGDIITPVGLWRSMQNRCAVAHALTCTENPELLFQYRASETTIILGGVRTRKWHHPQRVICLGCGHPRIFASIFEDAWKIIGRPQDRPRQH